MGPDRVLLASDVEDGGNQARLVLAHLPLSDDRQA